MPQVKPAASSDDHDPPDQSPTEEQGMSDMHDLAPQNQGVTGIDPIPTSTNQGVMDVDEELDEEDLTKSCAFRVAEDRGCAAAEDDTYQWPRRTPKP